MGKKGGGTETTTQNSEIKLPAWLEKAGQDTYARAKDISQRPWSTYTGERVAPLSANQQLGGQIANQSQQAGRVPYGQAYQGMDAANQWGQATAGAGSGYVNQGGNMLGQTTQAVSQAEMANYMNPYTEMALNPVARNMRSAYLQDSNQQHSKDAAMGALGNSRRFIGDANRFGQYQQSLGDMYSKGYANSFNTALQAAMQDKNRQLSAAGQYGQLGQIGNTIANDSQQRMLAGAQGMSGLATQDSKLYDDAINRLLVTGGQEQAYNQQVDDVNTANYLENRDWDTSHELNTLIAAMSGTPHGQTTTGTTVAPSQNQSGGFGQILGSVAGALITSSEDSKENREMASDEKLADFIKSVPVETYDYKPDYVEKDDSYGGRKVGPMSQKWHKEADGIFGDTGNDKVIPMPQMAGALMGAIRHSLKENDNLKREVRQMKAGY